ncbi:hypothetical protein A6R68_06331, partial [Neotoma lepida]
MQRKVRQGKIYVNDLPMILHNLKISMSDSEMRQVLKTVDIDEFQDVLKTFSKMKGGRVAIDAVAAFLDSMAVPVNPETLKDVINHSHMDSNHTVDIGDIIFTLDELQQQYEEISLKEAIDMLDSMKRSYQSDKDRYLKGLENVEDNMEVDLKDFLMELKNTPDFKESIEKGKVTIQDFLTKFTDTLRTLKSERDVVQFKDIIRELANNDIFNECQNIQTTLGTVKLMSSDTIQVANLKDTFSDLNIPLRPEEQQMLEKTLDADEANELAKALDRVTSEKISIDDMKHISEGLELRVPDEELQKLDADISVDKDETLDLEEFLNHLIESQLSSAPERGTVDITKLDNVLEKMGVELTNEELQRLQEHMPVDRETMDIRDLDSVLRSMNIEITKREVEELKRNLSVDDKGTTDLDSLVNGLQVITGGKIDVSDVENAVKYVESERASREQLEEEKSFPTHGMQVDVSDLDSLLGNMTFQLTPEESPSKLPDYGGKVDVSSLDSILGEMQIKLSDKELTKLPDSLTGKEEIDANKLMDTIKAEKDIQEDIQEEYQKKLSDSVGATEGEDIDVHKLDSVLQAMDVKFSENEISDLKKDLQVDGKKIHSSDMRKVLGDMEIEVTDEELEWLQDTLPFDGGKVKLDNMDTVLKNLGVKLTPKEQERLKENLPPSDKTSNDKVYQNRLLEGVIASKIGTVDVANIDTILRNMDMKLTEMEKEDLIEKLPVDDARMVFQNRLLEEVKSMKGGDVDVCDVGNVVKEMGVTLTDSEHKALLEQLPIDDGTADVNKIDTILKNMGWKLTNDEIKDLKQNVPTDGIEENIKDLKNILEGMGVELTQQEYTDLLKNLLVDGGKADVNKLDTVVKNMGRRVSGMEFKDMTKNLPVRAGKVEMKKLIDAMKAFTGNKIAISDLQDVLESMGIELTDKMLSYLQKILPVDGGKVDINNIDTILENMGIKLTEAELKDLKEALPVDAGGKISVYKLLDAVKATRGESIDMADLEDVLENMGIELTDKEFMMLVGKLQVDEKGMVYWARVLKAVKSLKGGKLDVKFLNSFLENMGIKLPDKEVDQLRESLPVDDDGKIFQNTLLEKVKSLKDSGKIFYNRLLKAVKAFD